MTASLRQIVHLAHQRWAIEQHYQDLKSELGFDHFEGRTYSGWQHHVVLSAIAYSFLQSERRRRRPGPRLTFPAVRAIVKRSMANSGDCACSAEHVESLLANRVVHNRFWHENPWP